ncbi:CBL-interacting protein kinase 5 [Capsicum baccatum]|uniref:CBL-interacting protein kinase 5 n=1 Tax=Capsicum baccatum TaxID=33114 RepID=A0A2G2WWT2_CAPBA|nr:CBL-interacting protein kinase 5 [Capsicum baccatum]
MADDKEMSAPAMDVNGDVTGHIISTTIGGKNGELNQAPHLTNRTNRSIFDIVDDSDAESSSGHKEQIPSTMKPASLNAFDIISLFPFFVLSNLVEKDKSCRSDARFTTQNSASTIVSFKLLSSHLQFLLIELRSEFLESISCFRFAYAGMSDFLEQVGSSASQFLAKPMELSVDAVNLPKAQSISHA